MSRFDAQAMINISRKSDSCTDYGMFKMNITGSWITDQSDDLVDKTCPKMIANSNVLFMYNARGTPYNIKIGQVKRVGHEFEEPHQPSFPEDVAFVQYVWTPADNNSKLSKMEDNEKFWLFFPCRANHWTIHMKSDYSVAEETRSQLRSGLCDRTSLYRSEASELSRHFDVSNPTWYTDVNAFHESKMRLSHVRSRIGCERQGASPFRA
ncbi:unnamed protein product [Albugo candida]|uniref:Uncharacterized protein n=1 Tax=Albugo candida TaxID=65357 RepID=A0A024GK79_9STRA|nr:unnamed protein product [Albugo candida]|eukprot:CCI46744.1 unnamed protein product [Albugo candida]